ncbi:MAG: VIT family protein [Nitrospinaceae bacterium]|nr:VIT family protein [Nitrospinaceae bacterium]
MKQTGTQVLTEILETPNHLHKSHRVGWLRAAVMGANDGIVSTASLLIGVASAAASHNDILLAGVAGLVAGAMSMAAGEYVSVSSQVDTEQADIELEKHHLENHAEYELKELTDIYIERGLDQALAAKVATQLMQHDALEAHLRDELGIHERTSAKPIAAALTSAACFTLGAAFPVIVAYFSSIEQLILLVAGFSVLFLLVLGSLAAKAGGASKRKGAFRVVFWGVLAMLSTAMVGRLFAFLMG